MGLRRRSKSFADPMIHWKAVNEASRDRNSDL